MFLAKLGDGGKIKGGLGQHLVKGQAKLGEVFLLHHGLEGLRQPLHIGVGAYGLVHRHQPVIKIGDGACAVQFQLQHPKIGGVLPTGDDQGIVDLNRLLQSGMGVARDDNVNAVHCLGQLVVLALTVLRAGMGQADNEGGTLQLGQLLLQLCHHPPGGIGHRFKRHAGHGRAGVGVLSHQAKNAVVDPPTGEDDMILYPVVLHGLLQLLAPRPIQHSAVGLHDGGNRAAAGRRRLQHLRQTGGPVVKFMVAQRGHIIPHGS